MTGASGFVGRALCKALVAFGHHVRGVVRDYGADVPVSEKVAVAEISAETDWSGALSGIDTIVHLAARVHVMKETSENPLDAFRKVNTAGTERLARMAAQAGVCRFVYVSSVKVNGEITFERPFRESAEPNPMDPYAVSKWEAEQVLKKVSEEERLNVIILRPPLIYGPGVKGNILKLMRYINKGWPLPFGSIHNRRSLIGLANLTDALILAAQRGETSVQTFLISDGQDISTPDLIRKIAAAMRRKPRLLHVPEPVFGVASKMVPSLRPVFERLTGYLVVDSSKFRTVMRWRPPETIDMGIKAMVSDFLENNVV